jgi:hypothetical protein
MKQFKFRFYIGGRIKFEKIIEDISLSTAWKKAHRIADEYPTKRFIEIANI